MVVEMLGITFRNERFGQDGMTAYIKMVDHVKLTLGVIRASWLILAGTVL